MRVRPIFLIIIIVMSLGLGFGRVSASTAIFSESFDDIHVATDSFSFSSNSLLWPSDSYEILHDVTFSWPTARILLGVYGDFTIAIGVTADPSGNIQDWGKAYLYWFYPNGQEEFDSPYWYKDTTYNYFKKKEDYSMSISSLRYYIAGQNSDGYQVSISGSGTVEVLTDTKYRHYEINTLPSQVFVPTQYGKSMKLKKAVLHTDIATPSEGILRIKVYWDGSNVVLGSWGNITGGTLYIAGVNTGLQIQKDAWTTIVVAWSDTQQDYVYVNTLDNIYYGNFNIDVSSFGSLNDDSNTLIDDIEIYNYYVTPEQAQYVEKGVYAIKIDGKTYVIYPEGGDQLGTLSVTFLSSNGSVLGTGQLSDTNPLLTAPANTTRLSLERDNVERIYDLNGISTTELAFPALGDIVVKAIKVYVYPPSWNTLEIKTLDGKVVYRDNISTEASATLIYGKYYTFTVEGLNSNNETVTYSIVAQATDNLKLRFPDPDEAFKITTDHEKLIAKKDGDDLFAQFVAPSKVSGKIIVEAFDANNRKIYYVDSYFTGSSYTVQQDISDLEKALGREISYFRITVQTNDGFTATKLVANRINYSYLMSDKFFPEGLRLIFFTILGVFLVGRRNADLSPLTAFLTISIMSLVGWLSPPSWFIAELSVLSGIALYMSAVKTDIGRDIEALSRIRIWRIPLSFWIVAIALSYAPVIAHMFFPYFDFSDVYYSVKFMDDTVLQWFRGLAESSDWLTSTFGQVLYVGATGIKAIFMLLESIVTGFLPAWKVMGLDTPVGDSPLTMANIMQSIVYMAYAWTLYMARKGGVEA